MSHIVAVDMQIKGTELPALNAAVEALGGVLVLGQTTFKYWGREVGDYTDAQFEAMKARGITAGTCEHAIRLKNAEAGDWEIGLVRSADGQSFAPVYDFFGSRGAKLEARFGKRLSTLKDHLGAEISMRHAARKGLRARKTIEQDGSIVVDMYLD